MIDALGAQQPYSRYPLIWPLPQGAESFIVRESEVGAWTAEVDGMIAGHASRTVVADDATGRVWADALGVNVDELGCLSVLFVGPQFAATGVGGRLLDTAVAEIRASGLVPVLDVTTGTSSTASQVYRHRGWQLAGTGRPEWLPDGEPDVEFYALPAEVGTERWTGTVVRGHGVASGSSTASPYPAGAIELQAPHFADRGFSLQGLRQATINLDVGEPVEVVRPTVTLTEVAWTPLHGPETFSFVRCSVDDRQGYLYWPHPDTKPLHFQSGSVIELLLPEVPGLSYGDRLEVELPVGALRRVNQQ
ncbi:hypothetical protein GCM10027579_16650 [Calidifontibacter terrae]